MSRANNDEVKDLLFKLNCATTVNAKLRKENNELLKEVRQLKETIRDYEEARSLDFENERRWD